MNTPYSDYPIEYIDNDGKQCIFLETCWHNCNDFNTAVRAERLSDGISLVGGKMYVTSQIREDTFIVPKEIKELVIDSHFYIAYISTLVIKNHKLSITIAEQIDEYNPPAMYGNYINKITNKYCKSKLSKVIAPSSMACKDLRQSLFEILKFNYFSLDYYSSRDHKLHKLRLARNKDVLRDLLKNEFSIDLLEE